LEPPILDEIDLSQWLNATLVVELTRKVEDLEKEVARFQANCVKVQDYQQDLYATAEIWVLLFSFFTCFGV